MIGFDLFLIDHVFQPLVDRGARRCSCFGLARVAFIVAALTHVLSYTDVSVRSSWITLAVHGLLVGMDGVILLMNLRGVSRVEAVARPGRLNPARVLMFYPRMIWLGFGAVALGAASASLVAHVQSGDVPAIVRNIADVLAWAGYIGGAYLASCTLMPPPPPKPARQPAWAALQPG